MGMNKVLAAAALATTGAFGVTEAEAGGVQWSVTVGSPFYAPAPVYIPPPPVLYGPPVPVFWARGYHQPRHWDRDGDGIPNRYDHRYTPRWDRDGDGVPNRYDRYPNGRHGWQGYSGGHRGYDGRGGHDGRGREHWGGGNGGGNGGGRGGHDGRGGHGGGRY
jgi:hypothetical protein